MFKFVFFTIFLVIAILIYVFWPNIRTIYSSLNEDELINQNNLEENKFNTGLSKEKEFGITKKEILNYKPEKR